MLIAYIDAGTGAMLLQWIIAILIGSSLFFRSTIMRLFGRLFGRGKAASDETAEDEPEETEKTPEGKP